MWTPRDERLPLRVLSYSTHYVPDRAVYLVALLLLLSSDPQPATSLTLTASGPLKFAWHDAVNARFLHTHARNFRRRILDCTLGPGHTPLRARDFCLGPRRRHKSCEGLCGTVCRVRRNSATGRAHCGARDRPGQSGCLGVFYDWSLTVLASTSREQRYLCARAAQTSRVVLVGKQDVDMVPHNGLTRVFWPSDASNSSSPGVLVGFVNAETDVFVVGVLQDVEVCVPKQSSVQCSHGQSFHKSRMLSQ
jgi:hypothetical protein